MSEEYGIKIIASPEYIMLVQAPTGTINSFRDLFNATVRELQSKGLSTLTEKGFKMYLLEKEIFPGSEWRTYNYPKGDLISCIFKDPIARMHWDYPETRPSFVPEGKKDSKKDEKAPSSLTTLGKNFKAIFFKAGASAKPASSPAPAAKPASSPAHVAAPPEQQWADLSEQLQTYVAKNLNAAINPEGHWNANSNAWLRSFELNNPGVPILKSESAPSPPSGVGAGGRK